MSSETKWTPGPWYVEGKGIAAVVRGGDMTIVAVRHRLPGRRHEDNAHLIASAPKLHEALAEFVPELQSGKLTEAERIEKARTALASARGES